MKRTVPRSIASMLLILMLVLSLADGPGVFAAQQDAAATETIASDADELLPVDNTTPSDDGIPPEDDVSTDGSGMTAEEPVSVEESVPADVAMPAADGNSPPESPDGAVSSENVILGVPMISHTINAFSDEEGSEYDISVSGVLPADATLQVVVIPEEEASVIADALAETYMTAPGEERTELPPEDDAEDIVPVAEVHPSPPKEPDDPENEAPVEAVQQNTDENEGRIAGGLIEDSGAAFFYDISVISQGKKCQPEEYGEEVTVTLKNISAEEIVHIKADVADENGIIDETALSQVADDILTGAVETETIETVTEGEETSFSLGSFSIVTAQLLKLPPTNAKSTHVYWEITDEGKLIIRPENGYTEGTLPKQDSGASADASGAYWPWYKDYRTRITSVEVQGTIKTDSAIRGMFANCTNLTSVDLSGLDLSAASVINDMFAGCASLTSVDFSNTVARPTGLQQIKRLFQGCSNLADVNLDGIDFSKVQVNSNNNGFADVFTGAAAVSTISAQNTKINPNAANCIIKSPSGLKNLDLTGAAFVSFDTSTAASVFSGTNITNLTASNITFNISNGYTYLLQNATGVKDLTISDTTISPLNLSGLTGLERLNLSNSTIGSLDISTLSAMSYLNVTNANITLAGGTSFPTPAAAGTSWDYISGGSIERNLTTETVNDRTTQNGGILPAGIYRYSVGEGNLDRGNLGNDVIWELSEQGVLTIKPLSGNTGTISINSTDRLWRDYSGMIKEVKTEGTLSTAENTSFAGLFEGCSQLTSIDLLSIDTSNVTNMSRMFRNCASLTAVDLSGKNASAVTNMNDMLDGTAQLKKLDLTGFTNTENAKFKFDTLPVGIEITSDGSTYVEKPISGEWTIKPAGGDAVTGVNARTLISTYITDGKLNAGTYQKTGEGEVYISGEMQTDLIWEIVNGVLSIYPREGLTTAALKGRDTYGTESEELQHWPWNEYRDLIKKVEINRNEVTVDGSYAQLRRMFQGCTRLTEVDFSLFDTSDAYILNDMFNGCTSLESIKPGFKTTSKSQQMMRMFQGCTNLKTVDLSGMDLSGIGTENSSYHVNDVFKNTAIEKIIADNTTLSQYAANNLFKNYATIQEISLKGAKLAPGATNTSSMLDGLTALQKLDITGFENTANTGINLDTLPVGVTIISDGTTYVSLPKRGLWTVETVGGTVTEKSAGYLREYCISDNKLHPGNYTKTEGDTISDYGEFGYNNSLVWEITEANVLKIYPKDGTSGVLNGTTDENAARALAFWPWNDYRYRIEAVDITTGTVNAVTNASLQRMFQNCVNLKHVDLSALDASNATSISNMFNGCTSLTSVDLSGKNTSNLTQMQGVFNGCTSLTSVNMSGLDLSKISNATNCSNVFNNTALTEIHLSGTTINQHVAGNLLKGASALKKMNLSGATLSDGVTDISGLFSSLTPCDPNETDPIQIDLTGFNNPGAPLDLDALPVGVQITTDGALTVKTPFTGEWRKEGITDSLNAKDLRNDHIAENKLSSGTYTKLGEGLSLPFGEWGDLIWEMDETGKLLIYPKEKNAGGTIPSEGHWPWDAYRDSITAVEINAENGTVSTTTDAQLDRMFENCTGLTSYDFSGFNTTNVTSMDGMFKGCTSLERMDLTDLNTANVKKANSLFEGCTALNNVTLGASTFPALEQMSGMFKGCASLETVDLSNIDLTKMTTAEHCTDVFKNSGLTSIDLSGKTINHAVANGLLKGASRLKNIDLSNAAITSDVTDLSGLFSDLKACDPETEEPIEINLTDCNNPNAPLDLDALPVGVKLVTNGNTTVKTPFEGEWKHNETTQTFNAKTLRNDYIDNNSILNTGTYTKVGKGMALPYAVWGDLIWEIDENGELEIYPANGVSATIPENDHWPWDKYRDSIKSVKINERGTVVATDNADLTGMFQNCKNLESVDLTKLDTSKAQVMDELFGGCEKLSQINLTQLETANATSINGMFRDCKELKQIDLGQLNIANVTTASNLFDGCSSLETLTIPENSFPNLTKMNGMFSGCEKLESIAVGNINTTNVTQANDLFADCTSLKNIDLSGNNLSSLEEMSGMFCGTNLDNVNLTGRDLSKVAVADDVFKDASVESITAASAGTNKTILSQTAANNLFSNQPSLKQIYLKDAKLADGVTDISKMLSNLPALEYLDIEGFENNSAAKLTFDLLPVGVIIASDGTTYVTNPITGEWTADFGTVTEIQLSAQDLINKNYVTDEGKLIKGRYIKTGDGEYYVNGELENDLIWEIVGNGVLRIRPKSGTSGTLNKTVAQNADASVWPWNAYKDIIKSIEINQGDVNVANNANLSSMFRDLTNLTKVNLERLNIQNVKSLDHMFDGCTSLQDITLNFQKGSTAAVTNINGMFQGCTSLKSIDFNDLGTSSSGNLSYQDFLKGCGELTTLDLSNVYFGRNKTLDLTGNGNLQKIIIDPANNRQKLTINLPWETNKAGTWTFKDERFTECIILGDTVNAKINEIKQDGETKDGIRTTETGGVIEKISEYAPGFEDVGQTYYVIDNLDAYEIQIWDKTKVNSDGTTGGYRTIKNYAELANGELDISAAKYLPKNTDEDWMDSDDTSFRIRNEKRPDENGNIWSDAAGDEGHIEIYTPMQNAAEWKKVNTSKNEIGDTYYTYDAVPDKPDVIITIKNAALDVNGQRKDVVLEIDKFEITNPEEMDKNGYTDYRRALLGIGTMVDKDKLTKRIVFRNYILRETDQVEPYWKYGQSGNRQSGNKTSGTWIDASLKVVGGTPDQTMLFFIGDLDHPYYDQSKTGFGPGSEGVILRDGFVDGSLAISEPTKLDTYDYVEGKQVAHHEEPDSYGNYVVATWKDDATYKSRFYAEAYSNGASFTWTSGLNCDTNILEVSTALDIWEGMPPVSIRLTADKRLIVGKDTEGNEIEGTVSDGEFRFRVEKDDRISLADGNLAMHPLAPAGGIGVVDALGKAVFPDMVFDISSDRSFIPIGTYHYTITEIDEGTPEMGYDPAVHELVIEVLEAETMIASDTTGYVLKAWVDGVRLDPTAYSSMATDYGTAKKAAAGAGSRKYQETEWTWKDSESGTTYTYKYNADTGTDPVTGAQRKANTWYRDDGIEQDPPDDATADYTLSYGQVEIMADAQAQNDAITVTHDAIKDKTWTYTEDHTTYTYSFQPSYGPVPLDYNGWVNGKGSMDDAEVNDAWVQGQDWVDTSDPSYPSQDVKYIWEYIDEKTRWTDYTDYKTNREWEDEEGNTYRYEPVTKTKKIEEAERDYGGPQNALIRQTVWTDPNNIALKYSYDHRINYQNEEPSARGLYDYTDDADGTVYRHGTVYLKDYADYTDSGKIEDLFVRNPVGEILAFCRYERIEGTYLYVHYRPSVDANRNYRYDEDDNLLFERYYYSDGNNYMRESMVPSGVTRKGMEDMTLTEIGEAFSGNPALYGVYTMHDEENGKDYIVTPPPVTATRSLGQEWNRYSNDLSGNSETITYESIPRTATGEVALGRSGWMKYNAHGQKVDDVKAPPENAFVYTGQKYSWVKYVGDSTKGEAVSAPSLASQPESGKKVTYKNAWLREDGSGDKTIVTKPAEGAEAVFKLKFSDAPYAIPEGVKTDYIQGLEWTYETDVYAYKNGRWYKNNEELDEGVEPPDEATAVLWTEDDYREKDSKVTFTNRKWVALTVAKEAFGNGVSDTDTFDFVVTFKDLAGQELPVTADGIRSRIELDHEGEYRFKLRHGGSISFEGLTVGEKYRVEEVLTNGFTTEVEVRGDRGEATINGNYLVTNDGDEDKGINYSTVVEYRNTIVPSGVTIKKSTLNDKEGRFDFFISFDKGFVPELSDDEKTAKEFKETETPGVYNFKLRQNEELKIENLTPGVVYRIWEELQDGGEWTLENIDGKKSTLLENIAKAGTPEVHTFYNRSRFADVSVTKQTVKDKEGEFKFRISFDKGSGTLFKPGKFNHLVYDNDDVSYKFTSPDGISGIFVRDTDDGIAETYVITDTSVVYSEIRNDVEKTTTLVATDIELDVATGKATFSANGWQYEFSAFDTDYKSTLDLYQYTELKPVTVDEDNSVWEFTLGNGQTMQIMGVTNGTKYELWEDLTGGWSLVNAEKWDKGNNEWKTTTSPSGKTGKMNGEIVVADGEENADSDDHIYRYTNLGPPVKLIIGKEVTGNIGDRTKDFTFSLQVKEDKFKNTSVQTSDGRQVLFDESGLCTFTLKHGQYLELTGITSGTEYSVWEVDYSTDGYTTYLDKQELIEGTDYRTTMIRKEQRKADGILLYDTQHTFENTKTGALPTGHDTGPQSHWLWMFFAALAALCGLLPFKCIRLLNKQYDEAPDP